MKKFQIAFVGVNSLYGSMSALLLKQSPFIKKLKLFDPQDVAAGLDLATINTQCKVKTFQGHEQLEYAFRDADIIVISEESNDMVDSESHLMNVSENLNKYAKVISRASPDAIIVVASSPINCLVPIMSQLLAKAGCYNHNKVVGSTLVDTIRASALLAGHLNMDPKEVVLPVIGGSSEFTRVPVFSQSRPHFSLKQDVKHNLIMDIRRGDSVVLANKGRPEALNRAYSTVRFLNSIMSGLRGDPNVSDITLCRTDLVPGVDYFSLPVTFGRDGITKRFGIPSTTSREDEMVQEAIKNVKLDTDKADYIVKRTIGLPEHKCLTDNDLSSSRKDLFDLFVKSLPKPDKNQISSENREVKADDYSFTKLIKGDSINQFRAPNKKSDHCLPANNLKNVKLAESFFKSAGGCASPFQMPIHILEPLECPSRPLEIAEEEEIDEFLEQDVLHEKNLARFRDKETYKATSKDSLSNPPSKNMPSLPKQILQRKNVDPIANFKAIANDREHKKHSVRIMTNSIAVENQLKETHQEKSVDESMINGEINRKGKITNSVLDLGDTHNYDSGRKTPKKFEETNALNTEKEFHFSSSSGRCMKKKYHGPNQIDSYIFDLKTNRIIPKYNVYKIDKTKKTDYLPEDENGMSYIPSTVNESPNKRRTTENLENDENYKKLVTRLFQKLDGLKDELYFPLKPKGGANRNVKKCKKSFTDSAARSTPAIKNQTKIKNRNSTAEMVDNEGLKNEVHVPSHNNLQIYNNILEKIKCDTKMNQSNSAMKDKRDDDNDQLVRKKECCEVQQFVCPKCHTRVTCTSEKPQICETPSNSELSVEDKEEERKVFKQLHLGRFNKSSTQNDDMRVEISCENGEQEERLKKLKEKINEKLIPMMKQVRKPPKFMDDLSSPALDRTHQNIIKHLGMKESPTFPQRKANDSPLALHKGPSQLAPHFETQETTNLSKIRDKWQGVPFIVKSNEEQENIDGKNRAVFMKVVIPSARKENLNNTAEGLSTGLSSDMDEKVAVGVEDGVVQRSKTTNQRSSPYVKTTKGSAPILNKLQLIDRKHSKEKTKEFTKLQLLRLEGHQKVTELGDLNENSEIDQFYKEQIRKERRMELKADDVQNYMITKQRGSKKVLADGIVNDKGNLNTQPEKVCSESMKTTSKENTSANVLSGSKTITFDSERSQNTVPSDVNETKAASPTSCADVDKDKSADRNEAPEVEAIADSAVENQVSSDKVEEKVKDKLETMTARDSMCNMTSPSKKFEATNEPPMKIVRDDKIEADITGKRRPCEIEHSNGSPRADPNGAVETSKNPISKVFHRVPNKLQLLASVRNSKQSDKTRYSVQLHKKLGSVWEKALQGKPTQLQSETTKVHGSSKHLGNAIDRIQKKSAAVRMAKKNSLPVQKKPTLCRMKTAVNHAAILDGMTFPTCRKRKPTYNLLKGLASRSKRKSFSCMESKPVFNKPVKCISLGRPGIHPDKVRGGVLKTGRAVFPESLEYSQNGVQTAKVALEILKKNTIPFTVEMKRQERRHSSVLGNSKKLANITRNQQPRTSVQTHNSLFGNSASKNQKHLKPAQKPFDVASKLMSMPHVRHQVENVETPLGPLEVQPGLAQFNFTRIGKPLVMTESWGSSFTNEYSRSNVLPSLKDTREMFYLEEHQT